MVSMTSSETSHYQKQVFSRSLDELEWPSLESRRERSSLTFFYKIHSGTVSLDKDKYLTPAPNLRHTRASHESQYTRPFAYSDALKNSFFPRTIPVWNSLPSSLTLAKKSRLFYSFCAALKASRKLRKSRRYWHLRICCRKASFSAELRKSRVYAGILTKL